MRAGTADYSLSARAVRAINPPRRREFEQQNNRRQINFFGIYNLGEILPLATQEEIRHRVFDPVRSVERTVAGMCPDSDFIGKMLSSLGRRVPELQNLPELGWLGERLNHLHRILPEVVVQNGGMGKVVRTTLGVLTVGAYDTFGEPPAVVREHLSRVLPGAFAYGAAYAIVDDTLQDMPGDYISPKDKGSYHRAILQGLRTGEAIDTASLPDHPLAEELLKLYDTLLAHYPFETYRHLYHASEAMYTAQHNDAQWGATAAAKDGIAGMYPDVFIKAGMSRVVANILGRRTVGGEFYSRVINTTFGGQLKDDLADRVGDQAEGRVTTFTHPFNPADANPLYDLFAYDAYAAQQVYRGDPAAVEALTRFGAAEIGAHLIEHPGQAKDLLSTYPYTSEIARFVLTAAGLPTRFASYLDPSDIVLKKKAGVFLGARNQAKVDPRTFVCDRLDYINAVLQELVTSDEESELNEIVAYALDAGGKRLRPALTLMLAESMGIEYLTVEPLLKTVELFHTASLIFDDLPAQDNAFLRRGRPTAHVAFNEAGAQLAGIAMMSLGFGVLNELTNHYPSNRVTAVLEYFGSVLGPQRLCRGQDIDLRMERERRDVTGDAILEMYDLKTSTLIEAALAPLMMLTNRPADEIEQIKQYSHHAGIVFQIRDDILDIVGNVECLGKDVGNDAQKVNIARVYGLDEAERLMRCHLEAALRCCEGLPFNTDLLQSIVTHFACRKK